MKKVPHNWTVKGHLLADIAYTLEDNADAIPDEVFYSLTRNLQDVMETIHTDVTNEIKEEVKSELSQTYVKLTNQIETLQNTINDQTTVIKAMKKTLKSDNKSNKPSKPTAKKKKKAKEPQPTA